MLTIGIYGMHDPLNRGFAHDHGVAIIKNGEVLSSIELERVTRKKHDSRLAEFFDDIVKPWIESENELELVFVNSFFNNEFRTESGSINVKIPEDFVPEEIFRILDFNSSGIFKGKKLQCFVVSHELAHIGSCIPFYGNFKENSLLVHIDGGASVGANSVWTIKNQELKLLSRDWDSLKRVVNYYNDSEIARLCLGLKKEDHLSMPGKLMGFASHGNPQNEYFKMLLNNEIENKDIISRLFVFNDPTREKYCADIAATMQVDFEDTIVSFIKKWKEKTESEHLYYSGGAALNIHANTRILRECGFSSVNIPPVPSDCGLALGAASIIQWQAGKEITKCHPFLIKSFKDIESPIDSSFSETNVLKASALLNQGKIIATCFGGGECGPRALGHRSILVRPDCIDLRVRVSELMKKREWYRPVSPIMLPQIAHECLEGFDSEQELSQYMLGSWKVKREYASKFNGVIHVDQTVRAQTVTNGPENFLIYRLLELMYEKYKITGLINTSFNRRGEPIVQTIDEAREAASEMGIDYLWVEKDGESWLKAI